ncbi:hypothetical protein TVAG_141510 [Trichomonas vaginalis G3]|uniref:Coiled-coil domain-containing protein 39 n=1 Tax=Trichomonas vaginalis (strain ATCC PRA-98 / G3) TaxID=412133 RepID=A2FSU5_TRIV3|nr:coiled-coil domain-containing protein 39 family [Trichomonas vaginalis G3]EAX92034.1 hypothetical protein TVAG_141510 [Trichomonas vaginalis G3]KAI5548113.1 coiled-coil domain-containing protein 39 family [Trichomonas vaginalis G3]|eukprot:XP_001304964.1 hypothetical protein [Trichomonas vaginalis G3]
MDPSVNLYEQMPTFANKENRELHQRVMAKREELQKLDAECKDLQERVTTLTAHLKDCKVEITSTQELVTAKEAQAEDEKHLQTLSEREFGKIQVSLVQLEQKTQEIESKYSEVQAKVFKSEQRIETFKEELKVNEEQLQQWIQAAKDKEEDFLVLQRYKKEDESKIRQMIYEIEKNQGLVDAKRAELDQEITTTRALQIELDTTASQFRALHNERAELLEQWENTLKQLQSLNDSIDEKNKQYDQRKIEAEKLSTLTKEEETNLEKALKHNKTIDRNITIGDAVITKKHEAFEQQDKALREFNEVVETQRGAFELAESNERFIRAEIEELHRKTQLEIEKKNSYLERLKLTQNALDVQKDSTEEIQEQTKFIYDFIEKAKGTIKDKEKEIDAVKKTIYEESQALHDEKTKEKSVRAELEGSKSHNKALQAKISDLDREMMKQDGLKYNAKYQIAMMERKLGRIRGDIPEDQKQEFLDKIEKLEGELQKKVEHEKFIAEQIRRLDLDYRQCQRRKDNSMEKKIKLETELNEVTVDDDALTKAIERARQRKSEVLVQLNMLRIQVEKMTEQYAAKSDEIISLENRRQQLQLSMQERLLEIDEHLAALRITLKTEEEAKHKQVTELAERKKHEKVMANKFQIVMGTYKTEDGEEPTQAKNVIKFATQKEEISRRGDELDAEIKTAVKELKALERTMAKFSDNNDKFKEGFRTANDSENDVERKKALEEQKKNLQARLNARRMELRRSEEVHSASNKSYDDKTNYSMKIKSEIEKLKSNLAKQESENREETEKLKRATAILTKLREQHRKENNIPLEAKYPSTILEMDMELKLTKMVTDSIVDELSKIAAMNSEIMPHLQSYLTGIGLQMKIQHSPRKINRTSSSSSNSSANEIQVRPPSSGAPSRASSARSSSRSSKISHHIDLALENIKRDDETRSNSARSTKSINSVRSKNSQRSTRSRDSYNERQNDVDLSVQGITSARRAEPRITKPNLK